MSIEREWKQIKLKNVGECLRGVSYKPLIDLLLEKSTESCYLLRSTNIQDSKLTLRDIQIVRNSRVRDQQVLQPKDIVICMANGSKRLVGKSVQFNLEPRTYTIGAFMGIFRVKESNNTDYINYLFCTNRYKYYISTLVSGSSINNLKPSDIESLPFFIPSSFEEQKAIVSVLEKWDKYIELLDQKIQTKKNIKKYLQQVLLTGKVRLRGFNGDWFEYRLGNVCSLQKGTQLGRLEMIENGEFPVLNGGITYSGYTETWNVEENTVTISEGGNSCGFVNLIKEKFWSGGHCYSLKLYKDKVSREYLYFLLKEMQNQIMRLRVGSGLPNIQKQELQNFKIVIPSLEEQKAISSILSKSDEEIAMLEKQKEIIEDQRKYLLNNLVTGKIRLPKFRNNNE